MITETAQIAGLGRQDPKLAAMQRGAQRMSARNFDRQVAEFQLRVASLNGFTALGIPVTEVVG